MRKTPISRKILNILVAVSAIIVIIFDVKIYSASLPDLGDFGSFIESGRAAAAGLNPYGTYDLTNRNELDGSGDPFPNLNPPPSLPLFDLLGRLDPVVARFFWRIFSVIMYFITLVLLIQSYPRSLLVILWAFAFTGFWDTLLQGQIYFLLLILASIAWLGLKSGRSTFAGFLIGVIVAIKPNFAVWPALLLLAGHRRTAFFSGICTTVLFAIPVLLYSPQVYSQWLAVADEVSWYWSPWNTSLFGMFYRLNLPMLALPSAVLFLAALAIWAWRKKPSLLDISAVALVGSLLAAPLAWTGLTIALLPVYITHRWNSALLLSATLLMLPPFVTYELFSEPTTRVFGAVYYPLTLLLLVAGLFLVPGQKQHDPARVPGESDLAHC